MTEERTYPREWFSVFAGRIAAKTFTGETATKLRWLDSLGRTRSVSKISKYEKWYATREEAQQVVDDIREAREENMRIKRIRDAAPALLEALEAVELARLSDAPEDWQRATDLTATALSFAKGESA